MAAKGEKGENRCLQTETAMGLLIYRIDPAIQSRLRLVVEEEFASRKKVLYLSSLRALAQDSDKSPVEALAKIKARALSGQSLDTASFQSIDVDSSMAGPILKMLAKTGRLFCAGVKIAAAEEGSIVWEGEMLSKEIGRAEAFFRLSQSKEKIPLSEVKWLLAGEESCALIGERIGLAALAPAWQWMERSRTGPLCLEGREMKKFLEDEPRISWKINKEEPLRVFPQLVLCDPAGVCSSLWMEYPGKGRVAFEDLSPWIGSSKRLFEEEKSWEKDLLEAGYMRKSVGSSNYYCPADRASDALSLLFDVGWQVFDPLGKKAFKYGGCNFRIEESPDGICLRGDSDFEPALRALKEGKSWFEAGGASFWIDRKKELGRFEDLLEGQWNEGELRVGKEKLGALAGFLEDKGVSWDVRLKEAALTFRKKGGFDRVSPDASFQGELLEYQKAGVDWLSFLHGRGFGGLLADEMGLGKTVQMLAFFSQIRTNLPILIVCPTSLIYHWKMEFRRFLPEKSLYIHAGAQRGQTALDLSKRSFILTSYAILRQDGDLLRQLSFEIVVFDESNAIKNADTHTAKAAAALKAKARFCISGTPVENRAAELVSQFSVLMPRLVTVKDSFELLKRRTAPFLLRRKKSDVALDLPEKIDRIAWVEMGESQRALYEEFQEGAIRRLKPMVEADGIEAHRMEVLEAILRLRQICCDPRLIGKEPEGAKTLQALSDLEDLMAEDRKVLFYSQFTSMLDLIQEGCAKRGFPFLRIDGSTSLERRADAIERFQKEAGPAVFLLSLKAGGVGLNLTAADYVLLFDPWWNEAVERQAIDRAHRIGRRDTVFIKRYLTPGAIEEKMLSLKADKQLSADQLIEGAHPAEQFSACQWFDLLENH